MANLNFQRGLFFGYHPTVDFIFFTADDQAFLPNNEHNARAHAAGLKVKTVDKIAKGEYLAWWGEEAPKLLAEAQGAYDVAEANMNEAQAAIDALPKTAKANDRVKVNIRYTTAKNALNKAEEALTKAQADVDALSPDTDANMLDVVVTQEMLDENPDLGAQGVSLGDTIQVPKDDTQNTAEEIKADVKEAVSKKTARKKPAAKKEVAKKK